MAKPKTSQAEFDVDGEGTISITMSAVGKAGKKKTPSFTMSLLVANTDMRLINWLSKTFTGDFIYSHSVSQRTKCNKACFTWRLFEARAAQVIRRILPYMLCKRDQGEIALAWRELKESRPRTARLTSDELEARNDLRNKIRVLNGSEVAALPN